MESGSNDKFFGDHSSDSDCDKSQSNPFGSAANHDYNSRACLTKTLSHLDGFEGIIDTGASTKNSINDTTIDKDQNEDVKNNLPNDANLVCVTFWSSKF